MRELELRGAAGLFTSVRGIDCLARLQPPRHARDARARTRMSSRTRLAAASAKRSRIAVEPVRVEEAPVQEIVERRRGRSRGCRS